jgi:hypothetical protein
MDLEAKAGLDAEQRRRQRLAERGPKGGDQTPPVAENNGKVPERQPG